MRREDSLDCPIRRIHRTRKEQNGGKEREQRTKPILTSKVSPDASVDSFRFLGGVADAAGLSSESADDGVVVIVSSGSIEASLSYGRSNLRKKMFVTLVDLIFSFLFLLFVMAASASSGARVGRMSAQFNVDALPLLVGHGRLIAAGPLDFGVKEKEVELLEAETGQAADGRPAARHKLVQLLEKHLLALGPVAGSVGGRNVADSVAATAGVPVLEGRVFAPRRGRDCAGG